MTFKHIWIVEVQTTLSKWEPMHTINFNWRLTTEFHEWYKDGIFYSRKQAREVAKKMQAANIYKAQYRAVKYIRSPR